MGEGGGVGKMTAGEQRAALSLAGLFVVRMLGLFLILPVFSLYAESLAGSTPALAGLAIGIYGLSQALLQIPFGVWSDRYGRKRMILIGLGMFAAGGVIAALSDSIHGVIIGRALQGAGAIAAAVLALAADLTREEHRTKVMALIGVSIGVSFALSMVLGPLLNGWIGVRGIFWVCVALALAGMAVTLWLVPEPAQGIATGGAQARPGSFRHVLLDPQLLRLDAGVAILHLLLTATFVALPLALRDEAGLPSAQHWQLYLPALVLSMLTMVPFVAMAHRQRRMKPLFLGAILLLCLAELGLLEFRHGVFATGVLLWVYFTGFNLLEATLPSLVAKFCPPQAKGAAMGVYSTCQFLGAFLGGALGGALHGWLGLEGVFVFAALAALVWFVLAWSMQDPRWLSSYLLNIGIISEQEAPQVASRLSQVPGVAEAVVIAAEGVAYLKVDQRALDEAALLRAAGVRS
ncbi:MAG TPA: MFS transporter [Candidatus Competibacteraceae bacterium]|nr:MFS transporter [Candidatus Competibacteraceae bacterium]